MTSLQPALPVPHQTLRGRVINVANTVKTIPFLTIGPGGVLFVLFPGTMLHLFTGRTEQLTPPIQVILAMLRFIGVTGTTLGLLSVLSFSVQSRAQERGFARALAVFYSTWGTTMLSNYLHNRDWYDARSVLSLAFAAYVAALVCVIEWRAADVAPADPPLGRAGTAAVGTWYLWGAQAAFFFGSALTIVLGLDHLLALLLRPGASNAFVADQFRLCACYFTTLGLYSLLAMQNQPTWVWRSFAGIFAFLSGGIVLDMLVGQSPLLWTPWVLLWVLPVLGFLVGNLIALRQPLPTWLEDAPESVGGWKEGDIVPGAPMGLQTLLTRRRASHLLGTGARGKFVVAARDSAGPQFPENDFFVPGRELDLRIRFANLTILDDAGLDVRGASIKLADTDWDSPFDMVLNTGSFCPVSHLLGFTLLVGSKFMPEAAEGFVVRRNPLMLKGAVAGMRRAPESFSDLRYYSQIIRGWETPDRRRYLVRYRLVPDAEVPESGLPNAEDCSHVWQRARLKTDHRTSDYLRRELRERVAREPVKLRFEAQFHPYLPTLAIQWYDASLEWEEHTHPWMTLGHLTLTAALADEELERTRFSPGNKPPSLFIFGASSLLDPRSLGDSEVRVMVRLQQFRMWLQRFGRLRFGAVANVRGGDR
jgi:arachidonate 5-lipoxygenase